MTELAAVLAAFHEATGCEVAVWTQPPGGGGGAPVMEAIAPPGGEPGWFVAPPLDDTLIDVATAGGPVLVAALVGSRRAWLTLGPCPDSTLPLRSLLKFLLPVVSQYLQSSLEVEHAAAELAERYEEINLLYTTSEILGRAVTIEETAATILEEISETVGAQRASILVHDRVTDTLQVVAALEVDPHDAPPIAVDDPRSVSAKVYRQRHPMIVERDDMPCEAEQLYRRGSMLSVPIMWTARDGAQPLGVVNLSGRGHDQPFTAGDQKLIAAIATQIGTAIQNARLVRASLNQQRLVQEMQLAHDLQMRLLPDTGLVAPDATVAARVMPAESVGGDFYHLFRLEGGRIGVMVGDVSSHGYRAALIMALVMSASTIHAQRTSDPHAVLNALLASLREELVSTEMFISLFYGVIDRKHRTLAYANTGHPHAFVLDRDGSAERLPASAPPLGLDMEAPVPPAVTRVWKPDSDLLVLFTDGLSDARDRAGRRLGEDAVLAIVRDSLLETPQVIVDRIFERVARHKGDTPRRDDLTMLVLRS
ncbi:MAG: PP2C family protein-serine/threonine phosphatase [Gemmatimonadaceae bacterium]